MASKAVNVPTDTKVKEKDINAKLQLYGIYAGEYSRVVIRAVFHVERHSRYSLLTHLQPLPRARSHQ